MRFLPLLIDLLSFGLASAHLLPHRKVTAQLTGKSMNPKVQIPVYYKYLNKHMQTKETIDSIQKKVDISSKSVSPVSSSNAKMPLQEILTGKEYNGSIVSIRGYGCII